MSDAATADDIDALDSPAPADGDRHLVRLRPVIMTASAMVIGMPVAEAFRTYGVL